MRMAYALGGATCEKKTGERRSIELGGIDPDWEGYVITGYGSNEFNNSYNLWYRGDHGSEKDFTRILKIEEGWGLNHAVALMLSAVWMHKSEIKNKTE